jgi:hypothetical protein
MSIMLFSHGCLGLAAIFMARPAKHSEEVDEIEVKFQQNVDYILRK